MIYILLCVSKRQDDSDLSPPACRLEHRRYLERRTGCAKGLRAAAELKAETANLEVIQSKYENISYYEPRIECGPRCAARKNISKLGENDYGKCTLICQADM